jgi:hypothetical protein
MRGFFLLLSGVVLCWVGILLCLPATSARELPSAFVRADAAQEMDGPANAPLPDSASYPITAVEEIQQTDRHPVNASLLTMLVLTLSFGASVLWMLVNECPRRAASCLWGVQDRGCLAVGCEGPSFLGVFRL